MIIENVGNLVFPGEFDVGEHATAMVCAVTEGEDKPFKYPVMFRSVNVVLLNKIDLLPQLDVSRDAYSDALRQVNPAARVIPETAWTHGSSGFERYRTERDMGADAVMPRNTWCCGASLEGCVRRCPTLPH